MRSPASHAPRAAPWREIAWRAYSEQLGWNRQLGVKSGEIAS